MSALISRNLKVFFRDRASVFFSLLAVLIILGLYILFLGDVMMQDFHGVPGAKALSDSWIMSGILAVISVTTVLGAFGTMVDDRAHKIIKDFSASPLSRGKLAGSYIVSSFVVGSAMTILAFALSEIYIVARGGTLLTLTQTAEVMGLILLSALSNTAMISFLVSFLKSQNAFGTASSLVGTLIGFLTGIYMPVGVLPEAMQAVVKVFPVSHAALLLRRIMMEAPMKAVFAGAPDAAVQSFRTQMGLSYSLGGAEIPASVSVAILAAAALIFYALSIIRFSKKEK
jgi:multidrug/hemolysin transport system permease protein